MPTKSQTETSTENTDPRNAMAALQKAGLDSMMGMSSAWARAVGELNAEFVEFLAERVKEDVKTQHKLLHCKTMDEVRDVQSAFMQKAMDQYHAETGKLMEMSSTLFSDVIKDAKTS